MPRRNQWASTDKTLEISLKTRTSYAKPNKKHKTILWITFEIDYNLAKWTSESFLEVKFFSKLIGNFSVLLKMSNAFQNNIHKLRKNHVVNHEQFSKRNQ